MISAIKKLTGIGAAIAFGCLLSACEPAPLPEASEKYEKIERVAIPQAGVAREPGLEAGWRLVWQDEFDGTVIDRMNWDFDVGCWGGGNNERQCYRDDRRNASIKDGKLVITALPETHTGPALPIHMREEADDPDARATKPYTSARLVTRGKAAWKYGRIEVRAKLPQGQGTWPAIWMLPESNAYGGWAASGEIDVMEAVNLGTLCDECPGGLESTILGTLHFGGLWPDNALDSSEMYAPEVLEGFNTFGIVWKPGRIDWTFNGKVFARKDADAWWSANSKNPDAPFDQHFHLILNLAIGGNLPERRGLGGVVSDGFPKNFEIDWVRVWKCDLQGNSDVACSGGE